ncbi:MAG: PriCT-2 domain-containing protein [Dolichospermum sp. OL03]|nr:PriCT-2 domain-containing protein [Dolichospermum sp. OL03]MCS6283075.1 PriCT-2 domain-containing protein [Dolichospermum sp.]
MSQQQFNNASESQNLNAQQQVNNELEAKQQFNNASESQQPHVQQKQQGEMSVSGSTEASPNVQTGAGGISPSPVIWSKVEQRPQPSTYLSGLYAGWVQLPFEYPVVPPFPAQESLFEFSSKIEQQLEGQQLTAQQTQFTPRLQPEPIQNDRIKFAFNPTGKDKNWDFRKLAANFQDRTGTIWDVARHVEEGHALCAGLLGGQWRSKSHIIGSQWLLLDIDNAATWKDANGNPLDADGRPIKINGAWVDINGNVIEKSDGRQAKKIYQHQLNLDEAIEHPFIKQYCALIYTTASHQPGWDKFRLVFVLPEYVQGAETVEVLTRYLMKHLPHDPACKDASRVFYGNSQATFPLIQPHVRLPQSWIDEAVTTAHQEKIEYEKRLAEITIRRLQFQDRAEANKWDIDQLIQQALTYIPTRSPGSNNYNECLNVLMALTSHYGAVDAEIIGEQWSPSIKGTSWNIRDKIRSFRGRSGISIGTLFHIAKQYGFRFPTVERNIFNSNYQDQEFNKNLHSSITDPIISKQEWLAKHGIKRDFQEFIQTLITVTNKAQRLIGNIVCPIEPTILVANNNLDVDIWFTSEQRTQTYVNAIKSGHKFILDLSHAGAGKSHTVGEFMPEQFGVNMLFYLSNEHRNPTVATIENWTDLPVRHDGLVADANKLTPLGNPQIRWPQLGEETNVDGTCPLTHLFNALAEKGYKKETSAEASLNPICNGCKLRANCAGRDAAGNALPKVNGSTFRRDRREALASKRIRANINSLPQAKDMIDMKAGGVVDEASRQIQPVEFIRVSSKDFDSSMMEVQTLLPGVYDKIKGLVLPLRGLLTGNIPRVQETYHGYNDELIRDLLGEIPTDIPEIIAELETIAPDIEELVQQADSITLDGVDKSDRSSFSRKTLKLIRSHLNKQAAQETYRNIENLPVRWLIPLLEIIGDIKPGALRVKNKHLIISTKNTRHVDVLKAFEFVFLMDATATRDNMAMQLGINPEEILVISETPPDYSNLNIHQITGFGLLNKDRSRPLKERVTALRKELDLRHDGNIAYIDHLAHKNKGDGYWFVDNRGSNAYENKQAICSFGTPYQDIGASEQAYITLTGDRSVGKENEAFQEVINHLVQTEVVQSVGRTRANRRTERVTYYVVSDKDLSYLADYYPNARFIKSDAVDICPEAGTEIQQTRKGILTAFKQLVAVGVTDWQKVRQGVLAKAAGISQSWLSQVAKKYFGGWNSFKKLLLLLYNSLYRVNNNSLEILTKEEQWFIDEYLPLLKYGCEGGGETAEMIIEDVITFSEHLGWQGFSRAVNAATMEIKAFLIACLISVLPQEIHDEIKRYLVLHLAKVEPEY